MKRITLSLLLLLTMSLPVSAQTNAAQQQQLQNLLEAARQANQQAPQIALPTTPPTPSTEAIADAVPPEVAPEFPTRSTRSTVTTPDVGADVRAEAFAGMTQQQLPMTPNQIRTLKKLFDETQRAVSEFPGVPPKPTSSSIAVSLAPGATPPVIRLLGGFVTSLVFVDATGAPWPIEAYDLGDPAAFNIQWDKKGNTLLVQSITHYKAANLAVQLEGLNTPVMVTLLPGQLAVDYRVDLHVPGLGPNALPLGAGLPGVESPLLLNVLSGIPPVGSKQLVVDPPGYADVWLLNGKLYIRTRATVLSPAWVSTISSSDGTHAYQMPLTPLMMISLNGKPINLAIEGY